MSMRNYESKFKSHHNEAFGKGSDKNTDPMKNYGRMVYNKYKSDLRLQNAFSEKKRELSRKISEESNPALEVRKRSATICIPQHFENKNKKMIKSYVLLPFLSYLISQTEVIKKNLYDIIMEIQNELSNYLRSRCSQSNQKPNAKIVTKQPASSSTSESNPSKRVLLKIPSSTVSFSGSGGHTSQPIKKNFRELIQQIHCLASNVKYLQVRASEIHGHDKNSSSSSAEQMKLLTKSISELTLSERNQEIDELLLKSRKIKDIVEEVHRSCIVQKLDILEKSTQDITMKDSEELFNSVDGVESIISNIEPIKSEIFSQKGLSESALRKSGVKPVLSVHSGDHQFKLHDHSSKTATGFLDDARLNPSLNNLSLTTDSHSEQMRQRSMRSRREYAKRLIQKQCNMLLQNSPRKYSGTTKASYENPPPTPQSTPSPLDSTSMASTTSSTTGAAESGKTIGTSTSDTLNALLHDKNKKVLLKKKSFFFEDSAAYYASKILAKFDVFGLQNRFSGSQPEIPIEKAAPTITEQQSKQSQTFSTDFNPTCCRCCASRDRLKNLRTTETHRRTNSHSQSSTYDRSVTEKPPPPPAAAPPALPSVTLTPKSFKRDLSTIIEETRHLNNQNDIFLSINSNETEQNFNISIADRETGTILQCVCLDAEQMKLANHKGIVKNNLTLLVINGHGAYNRFNSLGFFANQ